MLNSKVLIIFLLVAVAGLIPTNALKISYAADNDIVREADEENVRMSQFKTGATLTRDSLNPWDNDDAVSRG